MPAPEIIHQLTANFQQNREAYRSGKYNDARLLEVTRILFPQPPFECSKALSYLVIAHSHTNSAPTAC